MVHEYVSVSFVAGVPVCLACIDEVLVTVELPDHPAVPRPTWIQGVDPAPVNPGRPDPRGRIEMPIDGVTEVEIDKAQEVEPVADDAFGAGEGSLPDAGIHAVEEGGHAVPVLDRAEKRRDGPVPEVSTDRLGVELFGPGGDVDDGWIDLIDDIAFGPTPSPG